MNYIVFRHRIDSEDTEYLTGKNGKAKIFASVKEAVQAALESGFVLDNLCGLHIDECE